MKAMFDAHNHFTNKNSILCTAELLPQNITNDCLIDFNLLSSSEIGLDKRFESILPLSEQMQLLKKMIHYANENEIAITLHCVKRTEALVNSLKETSPKNGLIIWHGFNGSIETAKILLNSGIIISIGPNYNKDITSLFRLSDNIVLESDYEGNSEEEHDKLINNLYDKVSGITGIPIKILEERCINATKAFKNRVDFRN